MLYLTEIFQCFLSAREVARSRERDRISNGSTGTTCPGAREEEPQQQLVQERRDSGHLAEGQDLYTAACNSVIHRSALLLLGISPVIDHLDTETEDGQQQVSAVATHEATAAMTR